MVRTILRLFFHYVWPKLPGHSRLMHEASKRFFGGETPEDCLSVCAELNRRGFACMLHFAGEHTNTPEMRDLSIAHYSLLADEIKIRGLEADLSMKLSQFGFFGNMLHRGKTEARFNSLLEKAKACGIRVWIDGEELKFEKKTDDIIEKISRAIAPAGKVIQAYNKNPHASLSRHMRPGMFFRVCKGAYSESGGITHTKDDDITKSFKELVVFLLRQGYFVQVATHDARLIEWIFEHVGTGHISAEQAEIGMLLGVDMALARWAAEKGLPVRIFVPFGKAAEKEAYIIRRIIERPRNIFLPIFALFKSKSEAF